MKADTRNGYVRRYDACIRQVRDAMTADDVSPEMLERYQVLVSAGKELETLIYEGENTLHVSNKLQAYESRVMNALGGDFNYRSADVAEGVPESGSIPDMIVQAQTLLTQAYAAALEKSPISAHVPAVIAIKSKADELKVVLADVMRVSVHLS
jgi:hypothetical protein